MQFKDYKYERPDVAAIREKFETMKIAFNSADSAEKQICLVKEFNDIRNHVDSMFTLVSIRFSLDTTDEFYVKEHEWMDEMGPVMQEIINEYYKMIMDSKFKQALEEAFGAHLFHLIDMELKTFHPDIMPLLEEENKLASEYSKLMASAKIMFDGEERNLSQMAPYTESKDRSIRKQAQEAVTSFMEEHEQAIDTIYDKMVKVRDKMAKKLGFKNFVELGYLRLSRGEYDASMVATYREEVKRVLVPIVTALKKDQSARLGIDDLKYYDLGLMYLDGNAKPCGDPDWIVAHGKKMYEELSPETNEFIHHMLDNGLMDLVAKKGKSGGGYCTYIPDYKSPFIFSNFNGTSGDVDVLTHEAGHAFQCYMSRNHEIPEYVWATYEASEIHSMSMEFLTYPWMERFFEEQVDKYKYAHLVGAVSFIPYGVLVDHFQHEVYEHPDMTPAERKAVWRKLEKEYLPFKDYEDNTFLERGGFWFKQGHIFGTPFYYIDYTLAQVCAFQFYVKSLADRESAWADYLRLCKAGGSRPFLQLVALANLESPFEPGMLDRTIPRVMQEVEKVRPHE